MYYMDGRWTTTTTDDDDDGLEGAQGPWGLGGLGALGTSRAWGPVGHGSPLLLSQTTPLECPPRLLCQKLLLVALLHSSRLAWLVLPVWGLALGSSILIH